MAARQIGAAGLAIIKKYEGLRLTAYLCPANIWTIGYGSTGPHVKPGLTITAAAADALLQKDLDRFEAAVAKGALRSSQAQFDAMVALAFNIGTTAFLGSTLLRKHNAGDFPGARAEFARWNKSGGKVLAGLSNRRAAEAALYAA
jgi:Phage-related lysozyme (muraminidase)